MSEENVALFREITESDRRTALYCLDRFHGNMSLALDYFLENSGNLVIPNDFMPEEIEAPQQHEAAPPAPPTPSTETQNDSQQPTETTQNQQQEPVQTRRQRMATHKENGFYQKETPVLYFPFGVQFNESPTPNEYEETYTAQDSTLPKVYPINIDCKVVECIVYNNGILWDGSFTPKSDPKCTKAIDQIEKNILPTDFVDDTQFVEVDIKFNSDESYEENPK